MDITLPTPVLAGLSPQTFMRRHWQKKPLLIRQAVPNVQPPVTRSELFALAARTAKVVSHPARQSDGVQMQQLRR